MEVFLLLGGGQIHAPAALPPVEEPPGTHCIGDVPQIRSGRYGEVKIVYPMGTRILDSSIVQPEVSRYIDCATVGFREYELALKNIEKRNIIS
jgi:hypothetical protein